MSDGLHANNSVARKKSALLRVRLGQGFTLIELLVVIAIISLLSGVVFASLNGSREKARMAAGLHLSTQLQHAFTAEAAGIWDFDESSGNALDRSGKNNTAVVYGSAGRVVGIHGSAFQFDGSTQYLLTTSAVDAGSTWTFAAWVYPNVINDGIFLSFGNAYLKWTRRRFFFLWTDAAGTSRTIVDPITRKEGQWYFVAATHKNNATVLYVDGKQVVQDTTYDAGAISAPLYMGRHSSGTYLNGLLDEVHMYTESLLAKDIETLYLAGKDRHLSINR